MKLRKMTGGLGLVSAPWAYLAGRALPRSRLGKLALSLDPQYLRGVETAGYKGYSREFVGLFRQAALLASEVDSTVAQAIKQAIAVSESQFLQDVFCALTMGEKKGGYFVEVGVGSGKAISNTYMLEKHYGWSGLLVEPNRSSHDSIAACRSATFDSRAAASQSGKTLRFQEIVGMGEHSRIAGTGGHDMKSAEVLEYDVQTVSLTELLAEVGAPAEIDFLSLDTEGSELDILRGLDLKKYKFNVMTIEHNFDRAVQGELADMLIPLGYRQVLPHISAVDAWYVHQSVTSPGCSWSGSRA